MADIRSVWNVYVLNPYSFYISVIHMGKVLLPNLSKIGAKSELQGLEARSRL